MSGLNEHDFEEIFDQYFDLIYAGFFRRCKSHETSQDLTQITFIKLWTYRETVDPEIPMRIQLLRKAKLVFIDWLRQEAYVRERKKELKIEELTQLNELNFELRDQLEKALEQLPEVGKRVFKLAYIDGYKTKDIAAELNISVRTVENHLYRSVKKLRKILCLIIIYQQIQ